MNSCTDLYEPEPSWLVFHTHVAKDFFDLQDEEEKLDPMTTVGYDEALDYFNSVAEKANSLRTERRDVTQSEIAKECTDMLVRLPKVVLENTVVNVYDLSVCYERDGNNYFAPDAAAKSLMYMGADSLNGFGCILGRTPVDNDFPECGIRLTGGKSKFIHSHAQHSFRVPTKNVDDEMDEVLKYEYLPVLPTTLAPPLPLLAHALPKDRNSPTRVAFAISLQRFDQPLGVSTNPKVANVKRVRPFLEYLKSLLETTPGRHIVFAAVTNLHECFFVALIAMDIDGSTHEREYQPYNSAVVIGWKEVARELASFCATEPSAMGLNSAFSYSPHLTVESYVGSNSAGVLLKGQWKRESIGITVSIHKGALELERALLLYLEARGVAQVPRIHRAAQEDLYPRYNESCTAFSTILKQFTERCITLEQMLQAWGILRSLHTVGIVHCDVRAVNMMCDDDGVMYLTDFTAAQVYDASLAGEGLDDELQAQCDPRKVNTASAAVLDFDLPTLPADEGYAIIYAALQVNFPNSVANFPLPSPVNIWPQLRSLWNRRWYYCTNPTSKSNIDIINKSLAELEELRADPTYTAEHINSVVVMAVNAVYSLKDADETPLNDIGNVGLASGMGIVEADAPVVKKDAFEKVDVHCSGAYLSLSFLTIKRMDCTFYI